MTVCEHHSKQLHQWGEPLISRPTKMVNTSLFVALPIVTVFWLIVGGVVPWFIPKGTNRGWVLTCCTASLVDERNCRQIMCVVYNTWLWWVICYSISWWKCFWKSRRSRKRSIWVVWHWVQCVFFSFTGSFKRCSSLLPCVVTYCILTCPFTILCSDFYNVILNALLVYHINFCPWL